jgi:hypothetical protein
MAVQATVEFPEAGARQLELLASREGATPADLIRRIVEDHINRSPASASGSYSVSLPLIPASETGPIQPLTGHDVDRLLSDDYLPA